MAKLFTNFAIALAVAVIDGCFIGALTQSQEVGLIIAGLAGAITLLTLFLYDLRRPSRY